MTDSTQIIETKWELAEYICPSCSTRRYRARIHGLNKSYPAIYCHNCISYMTVGISWINGLGAPDHIWKSKSVYVKSIEDLDNIEIHLMASFINNNLGTDDKPVYCRINESEDIIHFIEWSRDILAKFNILLRPVHGDNSKPSYVYYARRLTNPPWYWCYVYIKTLDRIHKFPDNGHNIYTVRKKWSKKKVHTVEEWEML